MDVLAGTDFFTVEVLTWRGLVTYYVLFFIHLESRRVSIAGITNHPHEGHSRQNWLTQPQFFLIPRRRRFPTAQLSRLNP
jgi:hypothetical protein